MGWSIVNGHELADEALDAVTHWLRTAFSAWQKTGKPEAADWIRLLNESAPGIPQKQKAAIDKLAGKATQNRPDEVTAATKNVAEKVNRLFENDLQRPVTAEEFYLHVLIVLSSEEAFSEADKNEFKTLLKTFKS